MANQKTVIKKDEILPGGHWLSSVFSNEPALKAIEVAFLERVLARFHNDAAISMDAPNAQPQTFKHPEPSVQADFVRHQSPVFATIARALEASASTPAGFGRFRKED